MDKLDELSDNVYNEELERASEKLREALDKSDDLDAEEAQALFETAHESKSVVAKYMRENKAAVWQQDFDETIEQFENFREQATPAQIKQVENLKENIQKAIDANSPTAEKLLEELHKVVAQTMFNNDDIFIAIFYSMQQSPQDFTNPMLYRQLISQGEQCLQKGDISGLKSVVARLAQIMIRREGSKTNDMLKRAGITQ